MEPRGAKLTDRRAILTDHFDRQLVKFDNPGYSTDHPGVSIVFGVRVTPWLRFCMQVHIFHHGSVTTRCIALTFSTMLLNYLKFVNNQVG